MTQGSCELLRRLTRDQRGAFAVLYAVSLPLVAGILGLGIETGIWYDIKRHDQTIADIVAYSGALEIAGGNAANAVAAAEADAKTNGFDFANPANASSTVTVTTSNNISTVTATLYHQQTPLFVSYFLGSNDFKIGNQAIAQVRPDGACLSGVGTSGNFLLLGAILGNTSITMPNCTITSNSTSSSSIDVFSLIGDATITAYAIHTAGGINGGCSTNNGFLGNTEIILTEPPPACSAGVLTDPYASVAVATSPANLTSFAMPTLPTTATTFPALPTQPAQVTTPAAPATQTKSGTCSNTATFVSTTTCYNNAITISGAGAFLAATKYYFAKGVTVSAGALTFANNAQIYVATGNFTMNGGSAAFAQVTNASAPTSIYVNSGSLTFAPTTTFTGTGSSAYSFEASGGFTFAGTTTFGTANYAFYSGALALNGTTTLLPGTTSVYVPSGALTTAVGSTLTLCGTSAVGSCTGGATSSYALSATSYTFGGTVTFGSSSGSLKGYGLYGGALTISSGSNVGFLAPVNFYLATGSLTVNGCAAFQGGTSTLNINAGSLTVGSTGSVNFNANGTVCGTSYTSATSQYSINTGGNGTGVTLGGAAVLNAGTYYFMNSNSSGTGVAINGGTAGTPITLAAGIYSVQNGSLSIGSAAHVNFAAGTPCSPTGSPAPPAGSCIYTNNGNFTNAGVATFATGTYYLYNLGSSGSVTNTGTLTLGSSGTNVFYIDDPNGTFTNSSTASFGRGTSYIWDGTGGFSSTAGTLTFTGDTSSGSNYYFFDPTGGGNTVLNIAASATVAFSSATYYIVNGNLVVAPGATLTCPNCEIGGAGDTFVLTGIGSGSTLTNNIGTINIGSNGVFGGGGGITATLSAPGSGPYAGLIFFQDRNAPLTTPGFLDLCLGYGGTNCNALDGGNAMNITGATYLPRGSVDFWGLLGNVSSGACVVILADQVTVLSLLGSASLNSEGCAAAGVQTVTGGPYNVALTQ
jgi:hypothetical protein